MCSLLFTPTSCSDGDSILGGREVFWVKKKFRTSENGNGRKINKNERINQRPGRRPTKRNNARAHTRTKDKEQKEWTLVRALFLLTFVVVFLALLCGSGESRSGAEGSCGNLLLSTFLVECTVGHLVFELFQLLWLFFLGIWVSKTREKKKKSIRDCDHCTVLADSFYRKVFSIG